MKRAWWAGLVVGALGAGVLAATLPSLRAGTDREPKKIALEAIEIAGYDGLLERFNRVFTTELERLHKDARARHGLSKDAHVQYDPQHQVLLLFPDVSEVTSAAVAPQGSTP